MTKKCNPGVGAVPVNVIMIVLQIGPTYQTYGDRYVLIVSSMKLMYHKG